MVKKLLNSEIWKESSDIIRLYVYLLANARKKFDKIENGDALIGRGEIAVSLSQIAGDNQYEANGIIKKWDRSRIHRMLNKLVDKNHIRIIPNTDRTHLSICDYNKYYPKPRSKTNTYPDDSVEYRLAQYLKNWILKNNPKAKIPASLKPWCGHINKMIEVDKRSPEEIKSLIKWCQNDSFWWQNIRSAGKLRKQYDQLYIKMNGRAKQRDTRFDGLK